MQVFFILLKACCALVITKSFQHVTGHRLGLQQPWIAEARESAFEWTSLELPYSEFCIWSCAAWNLFLDFDDLIYVLAVS